MTGTDSGKADATRQDQDRWAGLCLGGGTAESAAGRIKVWNVGIDEVYVIGVEGEGRNGPGNLAHASPGRSEVLSVTPRE